MGYYIQGPHKGKGKFLVEEYGAVEVSSPTSEFVVPEDKGLICVVNNGPFEAAAFAFNKREMEYFLFDGTNRKKVWYLMDLKKIHELVGW